VAGRGRRGAAVAVVAVGLVAPSSASALPNRCATAPPERSPTWVSSLGAHWFDEQGLWTRGPDGDVFGHAGADAGGVQADPLANHAVQLRVSAEQQCVVAGDVSAGAPALGEYPAGAPPQVVQLPWLRRDGRLLRAGDGRTTILRGVDYPFNEEIFERPYDLTDEDFDRIASWGLNLLRIRLSGMRSGYAPGHAPEPGYLERLDHLIAAANRRGIYVIVSTVTHDLESLHVHQEHERAKFIEGTAAHRRWMDFQAAIFARYRDWPGVVGFDTINEDDSYPPYVHDQRFIGPAHRRIDALLRRADQRHVYFQEPSGWSYWGAEHWPGMMRGADLGDPNRFYCPKWKVGTAAGADLDVKARPAVESNAPMFLCEIWIDRGNDAGYAGVIARQRAALAAMDERLLGGARVLYGVSDGYGTHRRDGSESPWVQEFVRAYPLWAGGMIESVAYDFAQRRLDAAFTLDGSGPTEVFVPQRRAYPAGFVATASSGGRLVHDGAGVVEADGLAWDAARQVVVAPPATGALSLRVAPSAP
jgi:Cellulase (glycosyl hydrolase family 5)/Glycoside hydrolase family 5 C-terminal domain